MPLIDDPRVEGTASCTVVGAPGCIGGTAYPADKTGTGSFENDGTEQPKFDLRIDQEFGNGGRMTYAGGYAGTTGIVHTGIGPFNLQSGSYVGYGRIGYTKGTLKVFGFVNFLDAEAPNLIAQAVFAGHRAAREFGETPMEGTPFKVERIAV